MDFSYLWEANFSILSYPKLENITDYEISQFTNTEALMPKPESIKHKNPIIVLPNLPGHIIYWSYKTIISNYYIDRTYIIPIKTGFLSESSINYDANTEILSILHYINLSDTGIILELVGGFIIMTPGLEVLYRYDINLKDIHCNPYYPSQIAYLTDTDFCLLNKTNFSFECSGWEGFDFYFSPFQLVLHNSIKIDIKDIRQPKTTPLHTGSDIKQVLPLDCDYLVSVLSNGVEIYDCRYWGIIEKYNHLHKSNNWHLIEHPKRAGMYHDGILNGTHQSLYGISESLEQYPYTKTEFAQDLFADLLNTEKLCKTISNIGAFGITPLLAAAPLTIKNKEIWAQTSSNGGLFIENEWENSVSNILFNSKLVYTRRMQTSKLYDFKNYLENLISEELYIPLSQKPKLLITEDPEFEDFEDM
jgi:hypothetical protein